MQDCLVFLSRFYAFLKSFSIESVKTAAHIGLPAKACNVLKIFSSVFEFVNEHIRMKRPCVFVHRQDSQNA